MHCLDHRSVFHMETNVLWAKFYLPPSPHGMLFVRKGLPTSRPTLHRGGGRGERANTAYFFVSLPHTQLENFPIPKLSSMLFLQMSLYSAVLHFLSSCSRRLKTPCISTNFPFFDKLNVPCYIWMFGQCPSYSVWQLLPEKACLHYSFGIFSTTLPLEYPCCLRVQFSYT